MTIRRITASMTVGIGLLLASFPALGLTQQVAPFAVWCDTGNLPGIYDAPQTVCDARRAYANWQKPLVYFPNPAAPSYAPYGECKYWNDYDHGWFAIGNADRELVCPFNYNPVNFSPPPRGLCYPGSAADGVRNAGASPDNKGICQNTGVDPNKNKGPCPCPDKDKAPANNIGNPINAGVQNKHLTETDIRVVGVGAPLTLIRTYNSAFVSEIGSTSMIPVPLLFGRHWSSTYDTRVFLSTDGGIVTAWVTRPDGRLLYFNQSDSQWLPDPDIVDRLVRTFDGSGNPTGWVYYVAASEDSETYNVLGRLIAITTRSGLTQNLVYNAQWQISAVQDPFSRQSTFVYGSNGLLQSMTDAAGWVTAYQYNSYGNLIEVDYPGGTVRHYHYENTTYKSALTGITDENGVRYSTYSYDGSGKATTTQLAGGVNKWSVNSSGQITDPFGNVTTRTYSTVVGVVKLGLRDRPLSGMWERRQRPKRDLRHQRQPFDTHGLQQQEGVLRLRHGAQSGDGARRRHPVDGDTVARCWQRCPPAPTCARYRCSGTRAGGCRRRSPSPTASPPRPTTATAACFCAPTTALVNGNPIGVLCKKTVQETTDATGQQGLGAHVTGTPRVWQYTYDTFGQVLTATDPNGKTTTTVYYAANDPDLGKRGNVQTITNPLGHVTTITAYDLNGRPTSITDPNGTVTTLTYRPRGWLHIAHGGRRDHHLRLRRRRAAHQVTQPDGSYVQYTYDGAHRLTQLQDGLGNKIVYTLDAMGNRIKEEARDPGGTLARVKQQVFDSLNRLHQSVGAQ